MIAAVVVTYSAPARTLDECLASLRAAGGIDRVVVVDTGGSAAPADPDVEVIVMENRGYGAAANLGFAAARRAGAETIALFNDDLTVRPGWLDPVLAEFGDGVGAVQPKLLVAGSEPAVVNSLGVRLDPSAAGVDIGDGDLDVPGGEPSDLEMFIGGAVVFASTFLADTGGFDERYFLYYEDVDLALRGAARGWRYRLVPEAVVDHQRGISTARAPRRTRYLQERNRLWIASRFTDPATIVSAFWLSIRRLRWEPRSTHARALAAGLLGAPRRFVERWRSSRHSP